MTKYQLHNIFHGSKNRENYSCYKTDPCFIRASSMYWTTEPCKKLPSLPRLVSSPCKIWLLCQTMWVCSVYLIIELYVAAGGTSL